MKMLLILILAAPMVFAQHSEQPVAESNSDLRGQSVLFSMETPEGDVVSLIKSSSFEYFLLAGEKKEEEKKKIDAKAAQGLDLEFASLFIKAMYELPAYEGKCKKKWDLKMKGDEQKICQEDEQRHQLFQKFIDPLRKKYSF